MTPINIDAPPIGTLQSEPLVRIAMPMLDLIILGAIVGAFTIFGLVIAYASAAAGAPGWKENARRLADPRKANER